MSKLNLPANISFADLYDTNKLKLIDDMFLEFLKLRNFILYENLLKARNNYVGWNKELSNLIVDLAELLEYFLAEFFSIQNELDIEKSNYPGFNQVYECKRLFVQRIVAKEIKENSLSFNDIEAGLKKHISSELFSYPIEGFEQIFAEKVSLWQKNECHEALKFAKEYAFWAINSYEGKKKHKNTTLFKIQEKIDFSNLLNLCQKKVGEARVYFVKDEDCHKREGFKLTDKGGNSNFAVDQANYCIHCHNQSKDSCSKGLNEEQKGCPLDEKISEMNLLKAKASILGALAVAVIDNPLLAATGHRICNDCMKACIYQKQKPVDIPQIETRTLKDVLNLPWGFEIYSLLTRWNPLNIERFLPCADTGAKVLVAGMGPAGFNLAHHLLNEGHIVVGIDGLKIEPLNLNLLQEPIEDINKLFIELDERVVEGFGGVMEYGITNRWNKNFLLCIRLILERRVNFKLFSGVRLGSNITIKQAFDLGFSHLALCLGAGSPRILDVENSLARGVRTASDFLMSLQLGQSYKQDSLTNLMVRMPVVVIGGGLTALDAATESLSYYPLQVKKFASQFRDQVLTAEEKQIADEFLRDNRLLQESDNKLKTLKELGGVKIVYRQEIEKAPSYRLNHEELKLGLGEGVEFIDNFTPKKIIVDEFNHVKAIEGVQNLAGEIKQITIPARTILVAAGTTPNVILAEEFPEIFAKEGSYFKIIQDEFIIYNENNKTMSILGDLHPKYAGNVVKAMASSKKAYPIITKLIPKSDVNDKDDFFSHLDYLLKPKLKEVNRLTDNIIEMVIQAPLAARNFRPGQFFRLQNYHSNYMKLIEPIALTGAKVEGDFISTILLEMGSSTKLCKDIKINEELVLMGPTGTPTEILADKNIMLVGGGLGNAVLFSIGQEFKRNNAKVIYFAGYRKLSDRYKVEEIEKAADRIIWSCDEASLSITREQDLSFKGNIIESILFFAQENHEELKQIDKIIVIGSDGMMHALKCLKNTHLKPFLRDDVETIASINSPMQCMMKEICGQCIQKHVDPISGKETYVYSCKNQDQEIDRVDFYHLEQRLKQNSLAEKVNY